MVLTIRDYSIQDSKYLYFVANNLLYREDRVTKLVSTIAWWVFDKEKGLICKAKTVDDGLMAYEITFSYAYWNAMQYFLNNPPKPGYKIQTLLEKRPQSITYTDGCVHYLNDDEVTVMVNNGL